MKINVGVIGLGYWGRKIVDEYSRIETVTIDGVSDLGDENLRLCAQRYGIENSYRDYARLLARTSLQAVSICTPNSQHYQLTKAALGAGKHVLVEKPIALSSSHGRELIDIARTNRLILSVGHVFRFNRALAEIKRLIREEDYFGKLYLLEMDWINLEPAFPDRDVIWDQGPHIFDIQNYLTDEWPAELSCNAAAFRRKTGEESAYIIARFPSGIMSMAAISWLIPPKTRQIFIAGEKRSARVDVLSQTITIYEGGDRKNIPLQPNNTIREELIHFVESIANPDREPINSARIGTKTVELIEAAKRSIAEQRAIKLDGAAFPGLSAGV